MNNYLRTAREHKEADERCGRDWANDGCQCGACKMARNKHSGRPAKDGATNLKRVAVLLTLEQIEKATELGHGVLSLGVRRAIDEACTIPDR